MKYKNLLFLTIIGITIFFMSGCSGKSSAIVVNERNCQIAAYNNNYCSEKESDTYIVDALGEYNSFIHTNFNNSIRAGLQVSSELTLQKGMRYFAIIEPKSVSNVNGSMINTTKEFLDKCEFAMFENLVSSKCNLHTKPRRTQLMIKLYKEPQPNVLTFDAQNVLNDLKQLGYYQSDSELELSEIREIK